MPFKRCWRAGRVWQGDAPCRATNSVSQAPRELFSRTFLVVRNTLCGSRKFDVTTRKLHNFGEAELGSVTMQVQVPGCQKPIY